MLSDKSGRNSAWHHIVIYGVPVLATLLATLARLALAPLVGSAIPFVTYFAAAVLLAWYRGFWPATWSVLLSAVAGAYYVLGGQPAGRSQRAAVIGFAATSLTVSFLIDFQRKTLTRARSAERAQTAIARENALLLKQAQQSQEDLKRSNEELRRANRDLEIFAYSASHDLKEPLRTIAIYAELIQRNLQRKLLNDGASQLGHILAATRRMNTIVDDLLLYARATKSEEGPAPSVDAGAVIADVVDGLRGQINDAGATVSMEALPYVAIHRSGLAQLFQNLISNSIKYRGNELPRIHISAETADGWCTFHVVDNGLGMEQKFAEQIFGLFKRLHRREDYPGNGIGLAICQRLVEQYGGRIWLEKSEPGRGSTFCFSVPATGFWQSSGGEEAKSRSAGLSRDG
jgi:signal transduction histidine kinase